MLRRPPQFQRFRTMCYYYANASLSVISGEQYRLIEPLVCCSTTNHATRKKKSKAFFFFFFSKSFLHNVHKGSLKDLPFSDFGTMFNAYLACYFKIRIRKAAFQNSDLGSIPGVRLLHGNGGPYQVGIAGFISKNYKGQHPPLREPVYKFG